MKRTALILFLLTTPALACEDGSTCRSLVHVGAGATVSYAVVEITERNWAGPVAACGMGAVKEWGLDKNADLQDFGEWCLGGILGLAVNAMLNQPKDIEPEHDRLPRFQMVSVMETAGEIQEGLFVKWAAMRW